MYQLTVEISKSRCYPLCSYFLCVEKNFRYLFEKRVRESQLTYQEINLNLKNDFFVHFFLRLSIWLKRLKGIFTSCSKKNVRVYYNVNPKGFIIWKEGWAAGTVLIINSYNVKRRKYQSNPMATMSSLRVCVPFNVHWEIHNETANNAEWLTKGLLYIKNFSNIPDENL